MTAGEHQPRPNGLDLNDANTQEALKSVAYRCAWKVVRHLRRELAGILDARCAKCDSGQRLAKIEQDLNNRAQQAKGRKEGIKWGLALSLTGGIGTGGGLVALIAKLLGF